MKEYQSILDMYSNEYYLIYSRFIKEDQWGDMNLAEIFCSKYWMSLEEYNNCWKAKKDNVFINSDGLPNIMFAPTYEMMIVNGGVVFSSESFEKLQKCLINLGEEVFVIVQNMFGENEDEQLRFKFPINITWDELMSGNFISTALFEMWHNDYFVFGNNEVWGKYCANDYEESINVIGFNSDYHHLFKTNLMPSAEEWEELKDRIPLSYRSKILQPLGRGNP